MNTSFVKSLNTMLSIMVKSGIPAELPWSALLLLMLVLPFLMFIPSLRMLPSLYWILILSLIRTSVYFGRPYHSCDRASNDCNGLIRRFIKKGTDINTIDIAVSRSINRQINNKKRKILGYISAEQSFLHELTNIGFYDDSCFYVWSLILFPLSTCNSGFFNIQHHVKDL